MGERKMYNFPFVEDGQTYWRSRSCTTVGYVFCADKEGYLCVLANQRGPGAPTNVGKWNVPCGYIDFADKNGNEGVARETYEETGVKLKPEQFTFDSVSFSEDGDKNINLRFWVKLAGTIDEYPLSNAANEEGETSDIRWIRLCDVKNYDWAFGHEKTIFKMASHVEYTVDEDGVQTVTPYIVQVIKSETKMKEKNLLQKLGICTPDYDITTNGIFPVVVCDNVEKCLEFTKEHIHHLIEREKINGFEIESDEDLQNYLENSRYEIPVRMWKRDGDGRITERVVYNFYFAPIEKYE